MIQTHCPDKHRRTISRDVILSDGTNVNHSFVKDGWCWWWFQKYAPGSTKLERLEVEAREVRIPGYCERHEFPSVGALLKLSLFLSLAPPLPPSYAVALVLVTHGGKIQRAIEELVEQVQ